MSEMNPSMKVRLLVASWDETAPRGAVTAFCLEHKVSRSWFYKVRSDANKKGTWRALELASTRPKGHPAAVGKGTIELALAIRAELQGNGLDYGPLSVASKMRRRGLVPPSRATLARIFSRAGVVKAEPRKKPRSAYQRFVYPAPNCMWQIDATEWLLTNGRKVVIFQILDDHSRRALASLVAKGETAEAALQVVNTAICRHGVPQKFLSDNGAAFNSERRGFKTQLVTYLRSLGVDPITGKPGKPTTQGKNERSHQGLHQYLRAHETAATMDDLQALVDTYDAYYNNEREHQALAPGLTPREAWDATPAAPSPEPPASEPLIDLQHTTSRIARLKGCVHFEGVRYALGKRFTGQTFHIISNSVSVSFYDALGTEIATHQRPPKGVLRVGNDEPRGFMAKYELSTTP
jgi:putative transposase